MRVVLGIGMFAVAAVLIWVVATAGLTFLVNLEAPLAIRVTWLVGVALIGAYGSMRWVDGTLRKLR